MSDTPPSPLRALIATPLRAFALVFAGIAVLLVACYAAFLRSDYAPLYSDLRPADAAAIVAALEDQGIRYQLSDSGSEVLVRHGDLARARIHLASSDLAIGGLQGFELFDETDMGVTDFAERVRYQRAIQGEVARTIMRLDGVVEARVHISAPERSLFRSETRNTEAAVTLVMRSPADETPRLVEGVQRLVAAAVPDLDVADVVVLNGRGELISPRIGGAPIVGAAPTSNAPSRDLIITLVRQVLPDRVFEASVERSTPALAGDEPATIAAVEAYVVTIATPTALSGLEMEELSMVFRQAGIIGGPSANALDFRVSPNLAVREGVPNGIHPDAPPASIGWPTIALIALLGFGFVAALFLTVGSRFQRHTLPADEHNTFATRLRDALCNDPEGARHG